MTTTPIKPPADLEGQVALVVGASRGIGAAVAKRCAAAGASVMLAARDATELDNVARAIRATGGQALAVPTDVTDDDAVAHLVNETVSRFGRLDLACNTPGSGGHPPTPLADIEIADHDALYGVHLRGVFVAMKHQIRAMLGGGQGGAIVNVSSTAGVQAVGGLGAYVTAKFGLEGLTKVAALDYAAQNIRINSIAPGPILTDALRRAGPQAEQLAGQALPMRHVGQPEEVADAVVWLCSQHAAFITGSTLVIDGGKLAGTPPFARQPPTASTRTTGNTP